MTRTISSPTISKAGAIFRPTRPITSLSRRFRGRSAYPRVIVLLFFDRLPKKEVKFTRHNVFERDKNTCQYCGTIFDRNDLNLDHVVPRDRGGTTTWENVVCSCIPCNTRKGNRLPQEAQMSLIRKPKRPEMAAVFARHFLIATARELAALCRSRLLERRAERLILNRGLRGFRRISGKRKNSAIWKPQAESFGWNVELAATSCLNRGLRG